MTEIIIKLKNLNWLFIFLISFLSFVGLVMIYSATFGEESKIFISHIYKVTFGFILMILVSLIDVEFWKKNAYLFYFIGIVLLLWVTFYGYLGKGARRWINFYGLNFQPSELMKVFIILCLAKYFHRMKIENVNSIYTILTSLIIIILPMGLVIVQPDLGTSVLIAISGIAVLWFAGVNHKYFIYTLLGFVISLPFIIAFLKPYQKLRVLTFLNPDRDPLGAGYQIIQSKIAVGSGGLFCKGFLKGTQSYLEFLPEKHTDFIFTLFSEEFGFVGSVILLLIYAVIIYRIVAIGASCRSYFAKIFCYSFGAAIFVFITINMSMVLGLLPIVGSPLPIMSYGGSSMLATMIGFGIVMSARVHNQQLIA